MKKILSLIAVAFICCSIANAQTEKGTKYLGLNIGYSSNKEKYNEIDYASGMYLFNQEERTTNTFSIGPSFSWLVADRLELGLSAGYLHGTVEYESNSAQRLKQHQYAGSVFLRKHVMFTDKFGLRTGPYFSYSYMKLKTGEQDMSGQQQTEKQYSGGLNLGIEYFPLKRLGIAANLASLGYDHSKEEVEGTNSYNKSNSFNLAVTNALNLSVFWVFGKK